MNAAIFESFPVMRTANLLLAEVTGDHADSFVFIARFKDPSLSVDQAKEVIRRSVEEFRFRRAITWGLFLDHELIGTCGFYRGFEHKTGEVGYMMREAFRNKGYMTEALKAVLEFGFNQLDLEKIVAYTGEQNHNSIRLLRQSKFIRTEDVKNGDRKFERARHITIGTEF